MKKFGCITFILLAIIIAVGGFVLSRSGVQTKMANSFLKDNFPDSSLKSIHIVPGSFTLNGLDLKLSDTANIKIENASGKFLTRALFAKSIEISELEIAGFAAEIKNETDVPAKPEEPLTREQKNRALTNPVTEGMPNYANTAAPLPERKKELPNWDVSILSAKADASLKLPDSSLIKSDIALKSFTAQKLVRVKSFDLEFASQISMQGLNDEKLLLRSTMVPANNASAVKIAIEREGKKLVQISGKIDAEYKHVDMQTQIDAESSDVINIIKQVPDFKLNLFAQNNFDLDFSRIKTNLLLKLDAKNLKEFYTQAAENPNYKFLHPHLHRIAPISELSLSNEIAAEYSDKELAIANCDIVLSLNKAQVLHVKNMSAFKLNTENISQIPDGKLLQADIPVLPVNIVNAFLNDNLELLGSDISASLIFSKSGDDFFLKTQTPVSAPNFKFARDGEILIADISPTLELDASYNPNAYNVHALLFANPNNDKQLTIEAKANSVEGEAVTATVVDNYGKTSIIQDRKMREINLLMDINGDMGAFIRKENGAGAINIIATAEAVLTPTNISVNALKTRLISQKSGEILSANLLSKISYDFGKSKTKISGKFLEIQSQNVPFDIVKPFVPNISAKDFSVKILAEADGPNDIRADAEIAATSFAFIKDKAYILRGLDASAIGRITLQPDIKNLAVSVSEMKFSDGGASALIAQGNVKFSYADGFKLLSAALKSNGNVPTILKQPSLEKFSNASNGSVRVESTFADEKFWALISLANVSPKTSGETADNISLETSLTFENSTPKKLTAMLKSESALGKTAARLTVQNDESVVADFVSPIIIVDDFEILARAFTNPFFKDGTMRPESAVPQGQKRLLRPNLPQEYGTPTSTTTPQTQAPQAAQIVQIPDTIAMWDFGKNLTFNVKVGSVKRLNSEIASNLIGSLELNSSEIKIPNFYGKIFGANSNAFSHLSFGDNQYVLKDTKISMTGLRIDQFLQPNSAGDKMLVGAFDINANLHGDSGDVRTLFNTLNGNAHITSKRGRLHIIDRGAPANAIGMNALKLGGALLGNSVRELGAIGELMELLSGMNYSDINIDIERGNDLDIFVKNAEINAEHLTLRTAGVLKHNPAIPFADQAIHFPVSIYTKRGTIGDLFAKVGLLQHSAEDSNIAQGPSFTISGTLSHPKNDLSEIISRAARNAVIRVNNN